MEPVIPFVHTIAAGRNSLAAHSRVPRAKWRIGLGATGADRIPSNLRSLADVTRLQYKNFADDADVVLYTMKGEGHQWPSGMRVPAEWMLGPYNRSTDATREMWGVLS